jgi:hypothetical protein
MIIFVAWMSLAFLACIAWGIRHIANSLAQLVRLHERCHERLLDIDFHLAHNPPPWVRAQATPTAPDTQEGGAWVRAQAPPAAAEARQEGEA